MSLQDPIADFLTRVRNASSAGHKYVDVRWSTIIENMAKVLKDSSFIEHFLVRDLDGVRQMRVFLKYTVKGKPILRNLRRVSVPGCRRYVRYDKIPTVFNGLGVSILTTSQGLMTGQEARNKQIGGEILCLVW